MLTLVTVECIVKKLVRPVTATRLTGLIETDTDRHKEGNQQTIRQVHVHVYVISPCHVHLLTLSTFKSYSFKILSPFFKCYKDFQSHIVFDFPVWLLIQHKE